MGTFQFGHIDTYARKPKPGQSDSARSVREILGEAARMAENCPHVTNPKPPTHIAGMTPEALAKRIDTLLGERAIEGKRKPRGDVHVLAAAVYSWPEHVDYYDQARVEEWIADQLTWHRQHIGTVDCAVLHLDEAFPHVHVYTADPDARRLVPGWQAKRAALAAGAPGSEANKAYREAMTHWQDLLYDEVGRYHGLDRLGPQRQRLTRRELRATKEARFEAGDRLRQARQAGQIVGEAEMIWRGAIPLTVKPLPAERVTLAADDWQEASQKAAPKVGLLGGVSYSESQAKAYASEVARRWGRKVVIETMRQYQPLLELGEKAATITLAEKQVASAAKEAQEAAQKARQALAEVEVRAESQKTLEARYLAAKGRESNYEQALSEAVVREEKLGDRIEALEREKAELQQRLAQYERPAPPSSSSDWDDTPGMCP